jgi:hypothetical protein
MSAYMKMIYIDSDQNARHTNMGLERDSFAEMKAEFEKCREHAVDQASATFLLDLHNDAGDLEDTIPLDDRGFVAITGAKKLSDAVYRKIDDEYWSEARKQ